MGYSLLWATQHHGLLTTMGYSLLWATHYYGLLTTMGYSPPWATHYYGLSPGKPYVEALLPSVVVFGGEALGGS